jgi:hypothetical protein
MFFSRSHQSLSYSRILQHSTDPAGSLPRSQDILSEMNPVHTTPSYVCKIIFNIILPLTYGFLSGIFPSDFPTTILRAFPFSPMRATCPAFPFSTLSLNKKLIIIIIIQCYIRRIRNLYNGNAGCTRSARTPCFFIKLSDLNDDNVKRVWFWKAKRYTSTLKHWN